MPAFFVKKSGISGIQSGNRTEVKRATEAKAPKNKIPPYPATA